MYTEKKHNLLYKTTNGINGKFYIGVHSTNKIDDGYIGCGVFSQAYAKACVKASYKSPFLNAVHKYGYENFTREILEDFNTIEEAYIRENEIVNVAFIKRNDNYNACLGGRYRKVVPKYHYLKDELLEKIYSGVSIRQLAREYGISLVGLRNAVGPLDRSKIRNISAEMAAMRRTAIDKRAEDNKKVIVFNTGEVIEVKSYSVAAAITHHNQYALRATANKNTNYKDKGFRIYTKPYYLENGATYPRIKPYKSTRYTGMVVINKDGHTIKIANSYQFAKALGVSESCTRNMLSGKRKTASGWRVLV